MTHVDFKDVRDNVQIDRVADWLGVQLTKRFMSTELRGTCPRNGGGKRSLVINTKLNRWSCWAPECQRERDLASGDAIQLVMKLRQIPARDAALQLQSHFLNYLYREDFSPQEKLAKVEEKLIFEHQAVQALGLTPDQARLLGIGFMKGGTMPGRVLVPVRTREGQALGYLGLQPGSDVKLPKQWYI